MKRFVLILFFGWMTSFAFAVPVELKPLRKLIIDCEFIVTGKILDVVQWKREDSYFSDNGVVRLQIKEVLQGDIAVATIDIPFYNDVCSQSNYQEGVDIVVFLDRVNKTYYSHAGASGIKQFSQTAMETYVTRIHEMQSILKIAENGRKFTETVEWLVRCAQHEETRWDAETELFRTSDFIVNNFLTKELARNFHTMTWRWLILYLKVMRKKCCRFF